MGITMAKKSKKVQTFDDAAKGILSILLTEFREKSFGMEELRNTYQGLSPAALKSTCCADGTISHVDFDLAMKELDEGDLVKTGPMASYENDPNSSVVFLVFYSKNEYSYLTEEGYKAATRMGVIRLQKMPTPSLHISGGTFHQSPIGVGAQISQTVNIQANSDELITRLREEVRARVVDDEKQAAIMVQLDVLEDAQDQPSMLERYNKLVGVIGDHVTVFGPLLSLLLQRLMGN
jgi:hypothetical protein